MTALLPEPPEHEAEGSSCRRIRFRDAPRQCRPEIVVIALEPFEPGPLVVAGQLLGSLAGELEECVGVATRYLLGLAARGESLDGVGADRVGHREPDAVAGLGTADEALVGELADAVEHID